MHGKYVMLSSTCSLFGAMSLANWVIYWHKKDVIDNKRTKMDLSTYQTQNCRIQQNIKLTRNRDLQLSFQAMTFCPKLNLKVGLFTWFENDSDICIASHPAGLWWLYTFLNIILFQSIIINVWILNNTIIIIKCQITIMV